MNVTHMFHQFKLRLLPRVELREVLDEGFSDTNQRLLGPRKEPINRAFIEECWELSSAVSELLTDRREAEHDVEVISNSINEV